MTFRDFANHAGGRLPRLLLILSLAALVYSNTINAPFHFDDIHAIVKNPRVDCVYSIPRLFYDAGGPIGARPLTLATFALNREFGGDDTLGFHLFNIALHALNGVLLYLLVVITASCMGREGPWAEALGLISALLFVAHPVQTESITYIVSRSMLLVTAFYLSGIMFFQKAVTTGRMRYAAVLLLVALMGAASREDFVTFPAVLLIYDYLFLSGRNLRQVGKHLWAYVPPVAAVGYLLFLVFRCDYGGTAGFGIEEVGTTGYFLTQLRVHLTYLRVLALPFNQVLDYSYPVQAGLVGVGAIASLLCYAGLWALGLGLIRRSPGMAFCALWFMVTLAPTSSVMPLADLIFEHRLYLPSAGVFVALSAGLLYMGGLIKGMKFNIKRLAAVPALLLVVVLSVTSYARNEVWKTGSYMWEDVVAKSPQSARAHFNLGVAYASEGSKMKAAKQYLATLKLDPAFTDAYYNLGIIYKDMGLVDKAIEQYRAALSIRPDARTYNNIAVAYAIKGMMDQVITYCENAVRLDPDYHDAHFNLGLGYLRMDEIPNALQSFKDAIRTDPSNYEARQYLEHIIKNHLSVDAGA